MFKTKLFQTLLAVACTFVVGELASFAFYVGRPLRLAIWILGIVFIVNIWKSRF